MTVTCSRYGRDEKYVQSFEQRPYVEDLSEDGRILLK